MLDTRSIETGPSRGRVEMRVRSRGLPLVPELRGMLTARGPALMDTSDIWIKLTLAPVCRPLRKDASADERADSDRTDPSRCGDAFLGDTRVLQVEHLTIACRAFGAVVLEFFGAAR